MTNRIRKIFLFLGDILVIYASLWLAIYIRVLLTNLIDPADSIYFSQSLSNLFGLHLFPFTIIFVLWILVLFIDGWYDLETERQKPAKFYSILTRDVIINVLIAIAVFYFTINRLFDIRPQAILLLNIITFTALFILWRQTFIYINKSRRIANKIVIVGTLSKSEELANEIIKNPNYGYELVGIVDKENNISHNGKYKIFSNLENLFQIVKENKVNTIVTALDPEENPQTTKALFSCLALKVNFYNLASFYENITGKIPVTTIRHIWFLENLTEGRKKSYDSLKRLFEIVFSVLTLIISLPLWLIISMAIKISSPGPVIYKQKRVGQGSKNFTLIKFRSMIHNAENNGAVWAEKNDKRVTKLGNFLRKSRLDEIPQFINILKGEMSFIGPRPERPEFVEDLHQQIPFYKERLLVKPGLTGWAQTMGPAYGGSKEESLNKLQYDLFYIKNRSIYLDINIMLKTIKIVLSRRGI